MPAPGTIQLIHPTGALTLKRARLPELLEEHDVSTFRAPFGTTWHKAGTGQPRPAPGTIRGVLEGATPTETDDLLDELHAILPTVTHVWVGDWMIPVHGGGGRLTATPTLRGWAVEAPLLPTGEEWFGLVRDGLVAEYRFDEGSGSVLKDYSGNGNHGAVIGASWVPEGLYFDGVSDRVVVAAFAVPSLLTLGAVGEFALPQARTFTRLVEAISGGRGFAIQQDGTSGRDRFRLDTSELANQVKGNIYAIGAGPVHETWSVSPDTVVAYLNGALVDSAAYSQGDSIATTAALQMMAETAGDNRCREGTLSALLVYDRPLSDVEVARNHAYLKLALAVRGVVLT